MASVFINVWFCGLECRVRDSLIRVIESLFHVALDGSRGSFLHRVHGRVFHLPGKQGAQNQG